MCKSAGWRTLVGCALLLMAPAARAENYAVLFAGGVGSGSNEPRYYEQISRQYSALTSRLGYRPENIWIIFADGLDSTPDQSDGTDSDWSTQAGLGSPVLPGNRDDLFGVMDDFQDLDAHDMFYFFCFDHGNGTQDDKDDHTEEQICTWSGDYIDDDAFAAHCDTLGTDRTVYILGQCYSGGILEELSLSGDWQFGCASCTHFEKSYSWGFDGLNECWTDAINEQDDYMTGSLYVTAREDMGTYYDPSIAWGGEGPGSPIPYQMGGVTHPWRVGANIDISIARWQGDGTAYLGTQDFAAPGNWNEYHGGTQTVIVEFTEPGRAVVDDLAVMYFLSVDYSWSVAGMAKLELAPGGFLQPLHSLVVGDTAYGSLLQSGGECHPRSLLLGAKPWSYGVYDMQGGVFQTLMDADVAIGKRGYGLFNQVGGTVTIDSSAGYVRLGEQTTGSGEYRISGGSEVTLSAHGMKVGMAGAGQVTQSGGTVTLDENVLLGEAPGSEGHYHLSGGTLDCETIGVRNGTFTQTGGTVDARSGVGLGSSDEPGHTAHYGLSGSGVLHAYSLAVGVNNDGSLTQDGGSCEVEQRVEVGAGRGTQGVYTLNDGDLSAEDTIVAYRGSGTFWQYGGSAAFEGDVHVGYETEANGLFAMAGGDLQADGLCIGRWGTGRFI